MASLVDEGVQSSIITGLSQESVGASSSRLRRWDHLTQDAASLWSVAMTSPTIFASQGIRMLNGTPGTPPLQAPERQGT
jgi:hypothetical protein